MSADQTLIDPGREKGFEHETSSKMPVQKPQIERYFSRVVLEE